MHGGSVKIVGEKLLQLPAEKLQRRVDALPETEGQSADEDGDQQRAEKDLPEGMIVIPDIDLVRKDEGDFPALGHFLGEDPVTLEIVQSINPTLTIPEGDSATDNYYTRYIKDNMNIDISVKWSASSSDYKEGGRKFYPIKLPITLLMGELKKAGWQKEYDELLELFVDHANRMCEVGKNYPAHEVNYEQSIVAPAADVILSVYLLTGDKKYLDEGARQVEILELFNGMQPDYHLNEVAIRHWDGYWFGKRRYYGDTFPHYWSALTGKVFEMYGEILKDENWIRRGEASIRVLLRSLCQ